MNYILKKPIQLTSESPLITSLTFREEVVAGDMRGVPMRDPMLFDDVLKIAGRLCGQPDAVLNKMSLVDLLEVAPLVAGFMGIGLETGTAP